MKGLKTLRHVVKLSEQTEWAELVVGELVQEEAEWTLLGELLYYH